MIYSGVRRPHPKWQHNSCSGANLAKQIVYGEDLNIPLKLCKLEGSHPTTL